MHFKKLFAAHILDRGYFYFIDNAVTRPKDKDGIITVRVEGTRMYDVKIEHNGPDIIDMDCDCPYIEGGHNCKHMAAVIYAYTLKSQDKYRKNHLKNEKGRTQRISDLGRNQIS
ncbi:MAG: SWIM zinc finger domain-containing protein [Erysipelotrichaceae bacterium]